MPLANAGRLVPFAVLFLMAGCGDGSSGVGPGEQLQSAENTPSDLRAERVSNVALQVTWRDNATVESGYEVHRSASGPGGTFALVVTTAASASRHDDGGLTPLTEYCYRVRAVRERGGGKDQSQFSGTSCATTAGPPLTPPALSAAPFIDGSIRVTWSGVELAWDYHVERSAVAGGPWQRVLTDFVFAWNDYDQPIEQQACYRVIATGRYGDSPPTAPVCTARPAAPTGLVTTSAGATSIDVRWTDASAFESGYLLERSLNGSSWISLASLPANATSYRDAAVSAGTRYWYRVRALKDQGFSDYSNVLIAIASSTPPAPPTGVRAIALSSTTIEVRWADQSPDETGFRVDRSTDGGATWAAAGFVSWKPDSQFVTDAGRTPDQYVRYRVVAFNSVGDSPPSAVVETVAPKAPTDLVGTVNGSLTAIDLRWNDVSAVEDGYQVFVLDCYYYYYCYYLPIATLPAGATTWRHDGLARGAQVTYRVVAFKTAGGERGYSDPTRDVTVTIPQ